MLLLEHLVKLKVKVKVFTLLV